jgi:hypothetical protein
MGISPTKVLLATGGFEEAEISCGPRSVTRAGPKGPTRQIEGAVAMGRTKREVPRKRKTSTALVYA